jgi:hypothetical protein
MLKIKDFFFPFFEIFMNMCQHCVVKEAYPY